MEKKEKSKKLKKDFLKKFILLFINKSLSFRHRVIFQKSSFISSNLLKNSFFVHNGLSFRKLLVNRSIICFKYGMFVLTRKPFKYLLKKKKR